VTKAEIIAKIAADNNLDKLLVQEAVEGFFTVVKDTMAGGENLYVRGFGSFINKKRAEKVARNISKKTSITIAAHYIPSFKPAKTFVEQVKTSVKAD
jgi:DNA-binding protein HU-beta